MPHPRHTTLHNLFDGLISEKKVAGLIIQSAEDFHKETNSRSFRTHNKRRIERGGSDLAHIEDVQSMQSQ
jgi:hypothetical protein